MIDAEPALRVTLTGDDFDRALRAVADFVDLKSPYTLGHARAVAELAAATAEQLGLPDEETRCCGEPGSSTTSGGWASRTRSGTSPARWAPASGSGCDCTRI